MLLEHWNSIAAQLDAEEAYRPLIIIDASETALGKRWAKGFLRGVELQKESWSDCLDDKDRAEAISPIFALAHEDDPDPKVRFDALRRESRMDLVSLASLGVKKIHAYFRSRRVH